MPSSPTPPPYLAQATCAANLFHATFQEHYRALVEAGFLGPSPSPAVRAAAFFEVGCLHLYLLDHELRRGRKDDTLLIDLWRALGAQLIEPFDGTASDEHLSLMLGWRLGRYEDVTAPVEADRTYPDAITQQRDYFFRLAEQFARCLEADAAVQETAPLFIGTVSPENVPVELRLDVLRPLGTSFYQHCLPFQEAVRRWAHDGPFYEKSVAELEARVGLGAEDAEHLQERDHQANIDTYVYARWEQIYSADTHFVLSPQNEEASRTRQAVAQGEDGFPYLWVQPDPNGLPLRRWLLLAHDLRTGINTWDNPPAPEVQPLDLPLSLGGVDTLLRHGTHRPVSDLLVADLSDLENCRIVRPDVWFLGISARNMLCRLYPFQPVPAAPPAPQKPAGLLSRLLPRRAKAAHPAQTLISFTSEGRVSRIVDEAGANLLVVGPLDDEQAIRYLTWHLPPKAALRVEAQADLARYDLLDIGLTNAHGKAETFHAPTDAIRRMATDPATRFKRLDQVAHGPGSESYEVICRTDDADGLPLLSFALACYELGRSLALRAPDGRIVWWLDLGEVVRLLWEGNVIPFDTSAAARGKSRPAAFQPTQPADIPDFLDISEPVQRSIAETMEAVGCDAPRMGRLQTDDGELVFCFGPSPATPESVEWARYRIRWALPPGYRHFTFVDHPTLLPAPLPRS